MADPQPYRSARLAAAAIIDRAVIPRQRFRLVVDRDGVHEKALRDYLEWTTARGHPFYRLNAPLDYARPAAPSTRPLSPSGRVTFHFHQNHCTNGLKRTREGIRRPHSLSGRTDTSDAFARYIERKGAVELLGDGTRITLSTISADPTERAQFWTDIARHERLGGRIQTRIIAELPHELSAEGRKRVLENFVRRLREHDLPYTAVVHKPDGGSDPRNYHAHILYNHRQRTGDVKNGRIHPATRSPAWLRSLRTLWRENMNRELRREGFEKRYDERSYAELAIPKQPTQHLGKASARLEKAAIPTEVGVRNAEKELGYFLIRHGLVSEAAKHNLPQRRRQETAAPEETALLPPGPTEPVGEHLTRIHAHYLEIRLATRPRRRIAWIDREIKAGRIPAAEEEAAWDSRTEASEILLAVERELRSFRDYPAHPRFRADPYAARLAELEKPETRPRPDQLFQARLPTPANIQNPVKALATIIGQKVGAFVIAPEDEATIAARREQAKRARERDWRIETFLRRHALRFGLPHRIGEPDKSMRPLPPMVRDQPLAAFDTPPFTPPAKSRPDIPAATRPAMTPSPAPRREMHPTPKPEQSAGGRINDKGPHPLLRPIRVSTQPAKEAPPMPHAATASSDKPASASPHPPDQTAHSFGKGIAALPADRDQSHRVTGARLPISDTRIPRDSHAQAPPIAGRPASGSPPTPSPEIDRGEEPFPQAAPKDDKTPAVLPTRENTGREMLRARATGHPATHLPPGHEKRIDLYATRDEHADLRKLMTEMNAAAALRWNVREHRWYLDMTRPAAANVDLARLSSYRTEIAQEAFEKDRLRWITRIAEQKELRRTLRPAIRRYADEARRLRLMKIPERDRAWIAHPLMVPQRGTTAHARFVADLSSRSDEALYYSLNVTGSAITALRRRKTILEKRGAAPDPEQQEEIRAMIEAHAAVRDLLHRRLLAKRRLLQKQQSPRPEPQKLGAPASAQRPPPEEIARSASKSEPAPQLDFRALAHLRRSRGDPGREL